MEKRVSTFNYVHRIVLIDDDIDDHEIFLNSLQNLNHPIRTFTSGKRALHYLHQLQRSDHPSVIVTDYEMPEMDGMEVLKAIKQSPLLYHIPVIVYSSGMNLVLQQKLKANGAAGCFVKSDHLEDLKEFLLVLNVIFENSIFD
jgi:two-component system chemotaxis response regulator CheV